MIAETMSDEPNPNGRTDASIPEGGVLASLPRTRPQRASARRTAARSTAGKTVAQADRPVKQAKPPRARPAAAKESKKSLGKKSPAKSAPAKKLDSPATSKPGEPPVPKQGYEPEDEVELGATVNPPNGVELAESVVEIVSELANSGLAAGGRLLKDAFTLLRRP